MRRGQLTVGFVLQTAVGFLLAISLIYTSLEMEQDFKKTSMREALSSIASLVSTETLKAIDYVSVGTTTEKRITLPFMQENLGEYAVSFESQNNILFVQAKSLKWQNVIARQSLNLNSSHVLVNERESHPKLMCLDIQRNNTNYMIYITC